MSTLVPEFKGGDGNPILVTDRFLIERDGLNFSVTVGAAAFLKKATVTLNASNIQNLLATAVTVVPAAGARTLILPMWASILKSEGAAYTVGNGTVLRLGPVLGSSYTFCSIDPLVFGAGTILASTTESGTFWVPFANTISTFNSVPATFANCNSPIVIYQSAGAAITGAGSDAKVTVHYIEYVYPSFP